MPWGSAERGWRSLRWLRSLPPLAVTHAQRTSCLETAAESHVPEHRALKETMTEKMSLNWDSLRAESEMIEPSMQREHGHLDQQLHQPSLSWVIPSDWIPCHIPAQCMSSAPESRKAISLPVTKRTAWWFSLSISALLQTFPVLSFHVDALRKMSL